MILTLGLEVGADSQHGVTESTGPRLMVDVAASGRQDTGALGAGELTLSGTQAHAAVHPVRLSCRGAPAQYSRMCWRAWRRSASRSQDGRRRAF